MPVIAELKITMNEQGHVEVSGCIDNKLVSYGLLDIAHDVIHDLHQKAADRLVQPAGGVLPPFPPRN